MIGSRWSNLTVLLSYCFLKGYSQYAVIKKGITVIYSLSLATVWSFSCIFTPACLLGSGNLVKHLSFLFIQWLSLRLSVWERESEWERKTESSCHHVAGIQQLLAKPWPNCSQQPHLKCVCVCGCVCYSLQIPDQLPEYTKVSYTAAREITFSHF